MDLLEKYGCPPSQLEKLALTAFAAQRDPSMRAQVREVFKSMDRENQDRVRNIPRDIIAKAGAGAPEGTPEELGADGRPLDLTPKGVKEITLDTLPGAIPPFGYWDPFKVGPMAS